jgi:hypothetical protein
MMLILTGVLVGAVLGLRFKVFVLVPVICGALVIVVGDGIARGDAIWRLAFSMIMIVTALQLGYFLGNVIRFVMAPAPNQGRASLPTSARASGRAAGALIACHLCGVHVLVRGTARAEMFPHLVLLALHVVSQPQPRFCHVQENHLVVRVIDCLSQLDAGVGIRSVRITAVHERAPSLSHLTIARHLNAAPDRLFPAS